MGRRDCLTQTNFFLPRREPKGGRSGRWETQKKTGHPKLYDAIVNPAHHNRSNTFKTLAAISIVAAASRNSAIDQRGFQA